jgi:two-component system, OmpR family, heavy metal sensor histidine kinase CusS
VNVRSLRFRLALWYFCSVTAIFVLAATGYWFAIRSGLNTARDEGLRYRLIGLRAYLEGNGDHDPQLESRLRDIYHFGELYEVFDDNGAVIAQSYRLSLHKVPPQPPLDLGSEIRFDSSGPSDFPFRIAWQKVPIAGRTYILAAADPQAKYEGVLTKFRSVLLLSTAVILLVATLCGVWLGRRALAPVARITEDARAITESNLSARLAVPDSRDELQQLSETLNEMLERIEQSFKRTKQFTADASHELRAPLTLIYTAAQYALRRPRTRDELVDSLNKIQAESRRTSALIDELLLLARGDAGQEATEFEHIDARALVRDAADQAREMGGTKGIHVTLELDLEELPVRGSEVKLRRLLLILVDNAIKYTAPGGTVTLGANADDSTVTLSVADTGVGISAVDLPHIFERFWRADKVRSREVNGAGLGLPIARQISEQHGARLDVRSEPGRGSVFTVSMVRSAIRDRVTTVA